MEMMTQIMKTVFGDAWDFLSGVIVPGFGISAANVLLVIIRLITAFLFILCVVLGASRRGRD